jgi:predicted negative regulator of RcsB-dependent stress response
LQRRNLILIVIIVVLIIGVVVGVTLYEQQQVKSHLTKANAYHSQMMAYNDQLAIENFTGKATLIKNVTRPILINELNELRAADTMFASSTQKEYIKAAIEINTDNSKQNDIIIAASETSDTSKISKYISDYDDIDKDAKTATQTRDSLVAGHPEEFGFVVVKM